MSPTSTAAESEPRKHDLFIFLSTRVVQSGCDMIEEIGRLTGIRSKSDNNKIAAFQFSDLRHAIAKAQHTLACYDACVAAGIDTLTSEQFEAAAPKEIST